MDDATVPGLDREIREAIYDHIFAHDDHEVGGILVGRLGNGHLPEVTGMIAALEADGQRASVTFTHDAWAMIHATMDEEIAGEQIVGWYHSHPGFGIFLSNYDRFIHDNFFSDPHQIAYVVDPHAGTEGVFHWDNGSLEVLWEGAADRPGTGNRSRVIEHEAAAREGHDLGARTASKARVTAAARQQSPAPSLAFELPAESDRRIRATDAQRRAAAGIVGALLIMLIAALILTSGTGPAPGRPAKAGRLRPAPETLIHRRSNIPLRAGASRTVTAVVKIS
jgi:proteasome lid subunit RPN8/RPN11